MPKGASVGFRATHVERARLRLAAAVRGETVSQLLRRATSRELERLLTTRTVEPRANEGMDPGGIITRRGPEAG
jgi:hypothetical protein